MGVGHATINVHLTLQHFLQLPYNYQTTTNCFVKNPKLRLHSQKPWKLLMWYLVKLATIFVAAIIPSLHLCSIWRNPHSCTPFVEVLFYCFGLALSIQYFSSWYVSENKYRLLVFTQIFHHSKTVHSGWPWPITNRNADLAEIAGYALSVGFLVFPLTFIALPFIMPSDPVSLALMYFLPNIGITTRQFTSAAILFYLGMHASSISLLTILLEISGCHLVELSCQEIVSKCTSNIQAEQYSLNKFIKNTKPTKPRFLQENINMFVIEYQNCKVNNVSRIKQNFRKLRHQFHTMNIFVESFNDVNSIIIPGMVTAGLSVDTLALFIVIKMFSRLNFLMLAMFIFTLVFVPTLIVFFSHHAAMPLKYSIKLINYCKSHPQIMCSRIEKRYAKSMKPFGFLIGRFFFVQRGTALILLDAILTCTVNLLVVW